ncbi:MAG TPA: cupin domain-containing protein [Rhabdochlamydiaceae bacterium]|nr:cupin domain-containing protein [Rhabdochlamydiaceae bacterium]
MESKHKFDLGKGGAKRICKGGNRIMGSSLSFPFMQHMALATITLKKGGVREPHWHPNADEMTYCVEGKALITMFSPGNEHNTFTLSAGEVVYFPKGYIHHIENIFDGESRFILCYDHHSPEDLDLSQSIGSMSAHVLASTFGSSKEAFKKLKKHADDTFISRRKIIETRGSNHNFNKFNLEKIHPQIETKGGLARIANKTNFHALEHLALFSLRIAKKGVREPHWHPNATELNFVVQGKARLTILSPNGDIDTFELLPNQGSLIPAGYFHHIENIGSKELHMTVFFNNAVPDDIGLSGAISAYSNETLASLFGVKPEFFAQLHHFEEDRMIVTGGG